MNVWMIAALAMLGCMVPCFVALISGDPVRRLIALEAASVMTVLELLLLMEGYHRVPFVDMALTLTLLSFGAGLVFARFLERWL